MNPQYIGSKVTQALINGYYENAILLPRVLVPAKGNKAVVFELLRAWITSPDSPAIGTSKLVTSSNVGLALRAGSTLHDLEHVRVIFSWKRSSVNSFTSGGTGYSTWEQTREFDLTDGAGHGVLVAVEYLYHFIMTGEYTAVQHSHLKLLYRFKAVALTEFIGMVQSQTA